MQISLSVPRSSDSQTKQASDEDSKPEGSSSDASTSIIPQPNSNQGLNQTNWKFISNHSEDLITGDKTKE